MHHSDVFRPRACLVVPQRGTVSRTYTSVRKSNIRHDNFSFLSKAVEALEGTFQQLAGVV